MKAIELIPLAVLAALVRVACADDTVPDLPETAFLAEQPVVLSASRLAQSQREAPAMVTVIDREMIEASGFTEIADLLMLAPGFQVTHDRAWMPIVTYHGLAGDFNPRLQVLLDGRSLFSPALGHVYWREIPLALEDIERIEVVHGPNPAYGSNAFSAVVNIISRWGGADPGTTLAASAGTHDIRGASFIHSGQDTILGWRLGASLRQDKRFDGDPDLARDRYANGRLDKRLTGGDELFLQFGLFDGEWQDGHYIYNTEPPHTRQARDAYLHGQWRHALADGGEWSLQYSYTQQQHDKEWLVPPAVLGFALPVDNNFRVDRQQLEGQVLVPMGDSLRVTAGAEIRHDGVRSQHYFNQDERLTGTLYRLYGFGEWRPDAAWLVQAGGLLEHHYFAGRLLSPRLSVNYLPTPRHAWRASLTRAYRGQVFYEQEGNAQYTVNGITYLLMTVPNPDLQPEVVNAAELGYVGRFAGQRLTLNARLFDNRFHRLIDSIPAGAASTYVNSHHQRILGGEYQLQWKPDESLRLILGQAWANASGDAADHVESVPEHSLHLLAIGRLGSGWRMSAGLYQVSAMEWLFGGTVVKAHTRLDLRLAKSLNLAGFRAELALLAQNVGDKHYEFRDDTLYPERHLFEPRYFTSLELEF
jgi:iron complex outermembrane receptor protein